ncbi:hypothetical protein VTI74DRAFT_8425 [Chaetomium olivicolor]
MGTFGGARAAGRDGMRSSSSLENEDAWDEYLKSAARNLKRPAPSPAPDFARLATRPRVNPGALSSGIFEDVTTNNPADFSKQTGASFFASTGLSGNLFARQREDNPSIFAHLTEPSPSFDETDFGEFPGEARYSSFDLTALSTSSFAHSTANSFVSLASQTDPFVSAGFFLSFANQGADSSYSFANQTSSGSFKPLSLSSGAQGATFSTIANQTVSSHSSSNPLDFLSSSYPNQGAYSSSANLANQPHSSSLNPTGLPSPSFTNQGRNSPFNITNQPGFSASLNQSRPSTGALASNLMTSWSCFANQTSSSPSFKPTVSSGPYANQRASNSASNPANQNQIGSSATSLIPDISSGPFTWYEAVHNSSNLPNTVGYSSSATAATQPAPSYSTSPQHLEGAAVPTTFPFTFHTPLPASVAGLEDPFISPPPSRNSSRCLSQQQPQQSAQYPFQRTSQSSSQQTTQHSSQGLSALSSQQTARPSFQPQVLSLAQQPEQQPSQHHFGLSPQQLPDHPSQLSHLSNRPPQPLTMDLDDMLQNFHPTVPGNIVPNMDVLANIDPSILDPGEPDPEAMRSLEGIDPELLRALEQLPVVGQLAAGGIQNDSQPLTGELQHMEVSVSPEGAQSDGRCS